MRIGGKHSPEQDAYFNRVGQGQKAQEVEQVKKAPKDPPHPSSGSAVGGPGEEKVSLSSSGREVLRAKRLAESASDVRKQKVEEIKRAIEEGRYHVDAEVLADSLLHDPLSGLFS